MLSYKELGSAHELCGNCEAFAQQMRPVDQLRMHGIVQCCAAVRSTISAALHAVRRSIGSTAVCCGELYCVVVTRSGVIRRLSLRACQFSKVVFGQQKKSAVKVKLLNERIANVVE